MFGITENDINLVYELFKLSFYIYKVYDKQIYFLDKTYNADFKSSLIDFRKKEEELLEKLNLNPDKAIQLFNYASIKLAEIDNNSNMYDKSFCCEVEILAFHRLRSLFLGANTFLGLKNTYQKRKECIINLQKLNDDFSMINGDDELKKWKAAYYKNTDNMKDLLLDSSSYIYQLLDDDFVSLLLNMCDEVIDRSDDRLKQMLIRAKYNLLFMNPGVEDRILDDSSDKLEMISYFHTRNFSLMGEEYEELKDKKAKLFLGLTINKLISCGKDDIKNKDEERASIVLSRLYLKNILTFLSEEGMLSFLNITSLLSSIFNSYSFDQRKMDIIYGYIYGQTQVLIDEIKNRKDSEICIDVLKDELSKKDITRKKYKFF